MQIAVIIGFFASIVWHSGTNVCFSW